MKRALHVTDPCGDGGFLRAVLGSGGRGDVHDLLKPPNYLLRDAKSCQTENTRAPEPAHVDTKGAAATLRASFL